MSETTGMVIAAKLFNSQQTIEALKERVKVLETQVAEERYKAVLLAKQTSELKQSRDDYKRKWEKARRRSERNEE